MYEIKYFSSFNLHKISGNNSCYFTLETAFRAFFNAKSIFLYVILLLHSFTGRALGGRSISIRAIKKKVTSFSSLSLSPVPFRPCGTRHVLVMHETII